MHLHHRLLLASTASILALSLTGCGGILAPSDPYSYDTRDEAAAVAEEVYATFLTAADAYLSADTTGSDELSELATANVVEPFEITLAAIERDDHHFTGDSDFELEVTRFSDTEIVAKVCEDRTDLSIVNAAGASVVDPGIPVWVALEVTIDFVDGPRLVTREPIAREEACDHPLFDSDEAAQEAALYTYRKYTDTMLAVYEDGGENPERLTAYVTTAFYERELYRFIGLKATSTTLTPGSTINFTLAPEEVLMTDKDVMVMMCVDFTNFFQTTDGNPGWQVQARSKLIAVDLLFVQGPSGLVLEAEILRPDLASCGMH